MAGKISVLFFISFIWLVSIGVPVCPADDFQQISQARDEVFRLLDAERFTEAALGFDKLVVVFRNNPNLPWAKYWIAERYERHSKFDVAKLLYYNVIQNHPDSQEADKARLSIRRVEAMSLIASEKFEQANAAIDKLAADFAQNTDLPDTLYWITERFERASRFEEAKNGYGRIVQDFPNNPMADKAKLGIARAAVMALIAAKDFDKARQAIDKLTVDFAASPDLPGALYWITERYVWVDRLDEAKPVCQRVAASFPRSPYAGRARFRVAIADVMALIDSQNYDGAQTAFDNVVANFRDHQDLPLAAIIIGEKYYRQRKTSDSVARAKKAFQVITDQLPANPRSPEAFCWVGDCCTELGQHAEAITYYKRSCDGFSQYGCLPGSKFDNGFRSRSLYMLAQSYRKLIDANNISSEQTEPLIINSYERLVNEFGNSPVAKNAWRELGGIYAKKENSQNTVRCYEAYLKLIPEERCSADVFYNLGHAYDKTGRTGSAKETYKKFLSSVMPLDPRLQEVKARLSVIGSSE